MKSNLLLSAALATALLSACGENKSTEQSTTATAETTSASATPDSAKTAMSSGESTSSAATGSLTGAMAKMMQQMNANKPIGNTDHDFSHMMIAHHQGAIDMSEIELRDGKDATMKAMAAKIMADQKKEQGDFDKAAGRLDGSAKNYTPKDPNDKFQAGLDESMKIMMQPMTPSGNVDMDYAMMMVPHHKAAVAMSKTEVAHGQDAEVKKMAQMGIDKQSKEIQEFNDWMAKNGGKM
jgi:uncharacterized protein (DUF305 family)